MLVAMKPSRTYQALPTQQWLESEARLRAVIGPCNIELHTRAGRPVMVSAGAVAVVKAMEEAGYPPSEHRRPVVLRAALQVLLNTDLSGGR
jgi:hypothetical protein